MSAEPDEFAQIAPSQSRENLRARFPQSPRLILRRSFFAIFELLLAIIALLQPVEPIEGLYTPAFLRVLLFCIILLIASFIIKILYEIWYYFTYAYVLELENVIITRGVFFRSRASLPIAKINDVIIRRTPLDMIFQIYSVHIIAIMPLAPEEAEIQGLSRRRAAELQTYLLALMQTTMPHVSKAEANAAVPPPADEPAEQREGGVTIPADQL